MHDRQKLNRRFGLRRIVLVGDRGMITRARIADEVRPAGLDWLTALRAPAIRKLAAAEAGRPSPVAKARPSPAAKRKARIKCADDGLPVNGVRSLLGDLAALTRNTVRLGRAATFPVLATPTETQRHAIDLLGAKLEL